MTIKSTPAAYGRMAVTIHWLSALLVLVLLLSGFRAGQTTDLDAKAAILRVHVPVAITVLVLTLGRLLWWWRYDQKPAPLGNSPAWQETLARLTHGLLYVLLIVMLGSGIGLFVLSGAGPIVFGGEGILPDFADYTPRLAHGLGARALIALVALHAVAALYHHFIRKDSTLRRMWFGANRAG